MPIHDLDERRAYQRAWVAKRREEFAKHGRCVDCGSYHDLELDHVDPEQKVSHRIWSWSRARIRKEMAKCVWRCRACHQERHAAESRSHGIAGYEKRGCRCEVCRAAKAAKNERYRRRRERVAAGLTSPAVELRDWEAEKWPVDEEEGVA